MLTNLFETSPMSKEMGKKQGMLTETRKHSHLKSTLLATGSSLD